MEDRGRWNYKFYIFGEKNFWFRIVYLVKMYFLNEYKLNIFVNE